MWQKDAKFWGKSSPVLFPFVGVLKDQKFSYEGKEYNINTRHGFARDNEFVISSKGENFVEFLFESNEDTKEKYPFDFKLYLKYILEEHGFARDNEFVISSKGENFVEFLFESNEDTKEKYPFDFKLYLKYILEEKELKLEYRVENLTDGEMYFSIGAHPAFNIFSKDDGNYIEFEKDEMGRSLTVENNVIIDKKKDIFQGKIFNFDDNILKDTIIFEKTNSKKLWLKSKKDEKVLEFDYDGFEYIAFWNVPESNFICVEPWDGISDYYKTNGDITQKLGIKKLEKGEIYQKGIGIKIF